MKRAIGWLFFTTLLVVVVTGCGTNSSPSPRPPATPETVDEAQQGDETMRFQLTSPAFNHSTQIPVNYSCDGEDISPPLAWQDIPEGTQSLALVMDDPDAPAGTWVHWVLFDLPPGTEELPEQASLPEGAQVGKNSWGRTDYGGPCPPSGTHRYFFKLYALDTTLNFDSAPDKTQLLQAMEGHILARAELMGTYTSQ